MHWLRWIGAKTFSQSAAVSDSGCLILPLGVDPDGQTIGDHFHYYVTPSQLTVIGSSFLPFLLTPFVVAYFWYATGLRPFQGRRPVNWENELEVAAVLAILATALTIALAMAVQIFVRRRIWDQIIDPDIVKDPKATS